MVTTHSSIGKISSTPQPTKRYIVDDPTAQRIEEPIRPPNDEEMAELHMKQDIMEKVKAAKESKELITQTGRETIELLLGLKRKRESIIIDGVTITLQNLSGRNVKEIFSKLRELEESDTKTVQTVYDARNLVLGCSLYAINNELVTNILGDNDSFEMRMSLIEEMAEVVIVELYTFYTNNLSTDTDEKEVIADIKK